MIDAMADGRGETLAEIARRYATRFEPVCRDACLAWWTDPVAEASRPIVDREAETDADAGETLELAAFQFEPVPEHPFALLLDLSASGARVLVDRAPEGDRPVWLRLEGDRPGEWSEAGVVGVTTTPRGPHVVRLAFRAPCPFQTLRDAICG